MSRRGTSIHVVEAVSFSDEPEAKGLELIESVRLGAELVSRNKLRQSASQVQVPNRATEKMQATESGKSFVGRFELGNHCLHPDQFGNHVTREPHGDAVVWRQASPRGSSFLNEGRAIEKRENGCDALTGPQSR